MNVERDSATSSLIDVLDRVLDKGIVIDAWGRLSFIGIDLVTVEARVIVASFETYLKYADMLAHASPKTMTRGATAGTPTRVLTHLIPEA
jgi:gas vesicle structural protein